MRLIQSLTRGLEVVDALAESPYPIRLTDISRNLEFKKSNTAHMLKSLVAAGYVEQDSSRRYYLTNKVAKLQQRHSIEEIIRWKEKCRPVLEILSHKTGECTYLAVLAKDRVWYIDKIDSHFPLKVDHPIGNLAPLHCTALGKTFLAFGSVKLPEELSIFTKKTISNKKMLLKEIAKIRTQGFSCDDEEYAKGIRCVARPVFDETHRVIAAIGIAGPTVRINYKRFEELGTLINTFVK